MYKREKYLCVYWAAEGKCGGSLRGNCSLLRAKEMKE